MIFNLINLISIKCTHILNVCLGLVFILLYFFLLFNTTICLICQLTNFIFYLVVHYNPTFELLKVHYIIKFINTKYSYFQTHQLYRIVMIPEDKTYLNYFISFDFCFFIISFLFI